ncbi:hypothetical protein GCM10010201_32530 [Pilimelia columellifera subsp. columellifera]|uniref:Uncharacterized protein n=1 Tax=Pilimelia columellifera subsp. columellifera TaxID=706583 RepID=A0ABP6B0B2_9ACTN
MGDAGVELADEPAEGGLAAHRVEEGDLAGVFGHRSFLTEFLRAGRRLATGWAPPAPPEGSGGDGSRAPARRLGGRVSSLAHD